MKDGSDGESLSFKLKVVPLGFDAEGEEESSCIIEHVESAPAETTRRQLPGKGNETIVFDLLKIMAPSGTVAYDDLLAGYLAKTPKGESTNAQRRSHAKRALEGLIAKRLAYMHGEDRVSLTSLVTSGGDWLT